MNYKTVATKTVDEAYSDVYVLSRLTSNSHVNVAELSIRRRDKKQRRTIGRHQTESITPDNHFVYVNHFELYRTSYNSVTYKFTHMNKKHEMSI